MGYYPIHYIGKASDTLYLSEQKLQVPDKEYLYPKRTCADSTTMRIRVDSSVLLTHKVYMSHYSLSEARVVMDSSIAYHAYAIFVENYSDAMFTIGNHSELQFTVRQAKNAQGNWVDMEAPMEYFCGIGARELLLAPGELAVAMLLRYQGAFTTECRLKFVHEQQTVYSNVFIDSIDERQLTDALHTKLH